MTSRVQYKFIFVASYFKHFGAISIINEMLEVVNFGFKQLINMKYETLITLSLRIHLFIIS